MTQITTEFSPAEIDLFIDQGDDFSKIFTLRDADGEALDLTGYVASAKLRQYYNTEKDYNLQAEIYGPMTDGQIKVYMTSADSSLLEKPRYVYSVKLIGTNSSIRVLTGQAIVSPEA